ncbi:MAG: hypothetical protein ACR2QK_16285 [Acidimicrobiales bacterium]
MTSDSTADDQLQQLAATPGPVPDPTFVDGLDARLRVAHAQQTTRSRPRLALIPILGLAAVLVLGIAGALIIGGSDSTEVVMTVASDTDVYVDDRPVTASAGLVLPDGARIVVGPDGEAVVAGVVLAPGSEAIVVGDRVTLVVTGSEDRRPDSDRPSTGDPLDDGRTRSTVPPASRPSISVSSAGPALPAGDRTTIGPASTTTERLATTGRSTSDPIGTDSSAPTPSVGSATTGPTTTRATAPSSSTPPSDRSTSSRVTRPATTVPATRPTDRSTTAVTAPADEITLTATAVGDKRLRLDWVVGRDISPRGWRVRAKRGDRVSTVLVIRGGEARSATVERSLVSGLSVWVEALDRSGRVVAASEALPIR